MKKSSENTLVSSQSWQSLGLDSQVSPPSHGVEIDLIIDHRKSKELIEIKASETFHPKMVKSIEGLMESGDKGYLLYRGEEVPYLEDIKVLSYEAYLK